MTHLFFFFILGVPTSMMIIPLAWRLAPRLGMLDKPDARKVHVRPIPRVGGWGIVAGALLPVVIALPWNPVIQAFVFGAMALFIFGTWDDARQITHWYKFIGQFMAAAAVVYYGGLYVSDWPFVGEAIPIAYSKAATVIALMGMINAINHSDGLDGLAGGETMLSLIAIASLSYVASDNLTVAIAFSTMGGIIGFLRYNTHPADVFMGDSGSQFLGFTLGFLAIYVTQVATPTISAASPLLFLGLPVADILVVLYKRIKGKMNWFKATRNHVHHRFLDLGFDHYEAVVAIYSVQAVLVTLAVLMRYQSDLLVVSTYLAIIVSLFSLLSIAEARGWHRKSAGPSWITSLVGKLRGNQALKGLPLVLMSVLLPIILVAGSTLPVVVPRDFSVVAGVLSLLLAIEFVLDRSPGSPATRLSMYVGVVFCSYLFVNYPPVVDLPLSTLTMMLVGTVAVLVCIYIRYTSEHRFGATPTDYLIVFGVVALLIFGGLDVRTREPVQTITYSVVLLYACEALLGGIKSRWNPVVLATEACLVTLAIRGLL